ncbi:hypothetical protein ACB092_09G216100 [Castanea dentata]
MISSVRQSLGCRAIYASDLLFLRKKSLVVPIHQNSSLLLSALKKPAVQPLHVSTSVENLKFKCEAVTMSTVMKKKNITGAYLATRWSVPIVAVLNKMQQLNALKLTPYPTLSIVTLNLSPVKAGYASWPFSSSSFIEVVNSTDKDITFSIEKEVGEPSVCCSLKPWQEGKIEKELFEGPVESNMLTRVIITVGSKDMGGLIPQNFTNYKKLDFSFDNGKFVGKGLLHNKWKNLVFY